ncbi:MAG: cytochrome [archaeon]|jgi:hypothetical protein
MSKLIVGVMGGGENATKEDIKNAYEIGKFCASKGWITLTGGRNKGVMNEALKGAKENNGLTVGILPNDDKKSFSNYIDVPIITNMRSGRNYINALSSTIIVACGMGPGTSSEVSLAINSEKKVILVGVYEEANKFYKRLDQKKTLIAKDYKDAIELLKKELI